MFLLLSSSRFEILCVDMRKPCLISDGSVGGTGFMSWVYCTIA